MKRYGLILATMGMMLVTGGVLHQTGWTSRSAPLRHAKTADPLRTAAGWRYRQNQPHHWRYCLLQN